MRFKVTIDGKHVYEFDAPTEDEAKALAYRFHCATPAWTLGKRSEVTGCEEVKA